MKEFGLRLVSLEPAQVMVWEWEVREVLGTKCPLKLGQEAMLEKQKGKWQDGLYQRACCRYGEDRVGRAPSLRWGWWGPCSTFFLQVETTAMYLGMLSVKRSRMLNLTFPGISYGCAHTCVMLGLEPRALPAFTKQAH